MAREYRSPDADQYKMTYDDPHLEIEPAAQEIAIVQAALETLKADGILARIDYDHTKFLAHRAAVAANFEIPWTAITPRMQRLIYAVNAISQPQNMIAAGVFCGNTFFSNAGAATGPGASYTAENLIGIEIIPEEAQRAERNVRKVDATGVARIVAADAVEYVAEFDGEIGLLYLDADGGEHGDKGIYLDILEACYDKLPQGAIVLAHNSINNAERLSRYLAFVRDPANCRASVNMVFDTEGLEVSMK